MKKSTKGLIAAGAAGVLLLGGAGTLAFWTDDATVDGGELASGSIALTATDCSTAAWKHLEDDADADLLVPGDSVYKECTVTLVMEGDHIAADVEIDPDSLPAT